MRRPLLLILALSLISTPLLATNDFAKKTKSEPAEPIVAAVKPANPVKPVKMDDHKKKIEELKKQLNGSEWEVQMSSGGKALDKDTFTFQNNQVTCKTLKDRGYPPSNYTISMPEGADMATWETMQTSAKGQVVFIRAEWMEGVMRGVMSEPQEEGKTKDFNFASLSKIEVPPTTEKKEEKAPETAPEAGVLVSEPVLTPTPDTVVAPFEPGSTEEMPVRDEAKA